MISLDLSVILVNWNTDERTLRALESVYQDAADSSVSIEVFVVDNGSSDDSVTRIRENFPDTKVVENTHNLAGGTVTSPGDMGASIAAARSLGLRVHVDGARLWNAAVALGCEPAELVRGADSAMVTLSKGLCAPVGSILCSDRESIERARRIRKQFGGGMRQIGHLAAAGLIAVETMVSRLAEDHQKARRLAELARSAPGARVVPPETNILFVHFDAPKAQALADHLQAANIQASVMGDSSLRFVTHKDVTLVDCEAAGTALIEASKAI